MAESYRRGSPAGHYYPVALQVYRGIDRPVSESDGIRTQHCFSFGGHYVERNTHFGLLVACNSDWIAPGAGYADHPHQGLEIVTWVLSGTLAHEDSSRPGVSLVLPGAVQRLRAGCGVRHAETNPVGGEPLQLVQMWLVSDRPAEPLYEQLPVSVAPGALVVALRLADVAATLYVGRLGAAHTVALPGGPFVHLFLAVGEAVVSDIRLTAGDSLRITDTSNLMMTAVTSCEVLIWQMNRSL